MSRNMIAPMSTTKDQIINGRVATRKQISVRIRSVISFHMVHMNITNPTAVSTG